MNEFFLLHNIKPWRFILYFLWHNIYAENFTKYKCSPAHWIITGYQPFKVNSDKKNNMMGLFSFLLISFCCCWWSLHVPNTSAYIFVLYLILAMQLSECSWWSGYLLMCELPLIDCVRAIEIAVSSYLANICDCQHHSMHVYRHTCCIPLCFIELHSYWVF